MTASAALEPGLRGELWRTVARAHNGIRYLRGPDWAPVHATPHEVVWREGCAEVRRYRLGGPAPIGPPVLIIGGLVGRAYIFDLAQGNSFVGRMLDHGFDPYVLDWGAPGPSEATCSLDTYLLRWLPRAVRAVLREAGAEEVSMLGYCMGGTLAVHALAADRGLPVRSLVTMAAPVDFTGLGSLVDALRDGRLDPTSVLGDDGNVPATHVSTFFRLTKPTAPLVQFANLWENLWDDEYMRGFQALARCFGDHVPLAGAAFVDIAEGWVHANGFVADSLQLGGRRASLKALRMPVLVVLASRDELVPEPASAPLESLLPNASATTLRLDAGHASLTIGRTAARHTVPEILAWLAARSDT